MGMFRDMKDARAPARWTRPGRPPSTAAAGGSATIDAVSDTGMFVNEAPVLALDMTVTLPGREPYRTTHKQLVSHAVLARFQPGAVMPVRVSPQDPNQLMIG